MWEGVLALGGNSENVFCGVLFYNTFFLDKCRNKHFLLLLDSVARITVIM